MTTDAAAWVFSNLGSVVSDGSTTDIDFGRLQNMTPGGIPVSASRSATELVYNTSKETPLTLSQIQVTGANAADFVISPQTIAAAAATVLPANKDATLVLNAIRIVGANPAAFQLTTATSGFSNCFAGIPIGPLSFCYLAVGVAPGATPPANATFIVTSNDPVRPELDVPLTLVTAP